VPCWILRKGFLGRNRKIRSKAAFIACIRKAHGSLLQYVVKRKG
jgi:hypothetical protein